MLVVTLLPCSNSKQWWVRDFDFPRLQIFFITLSDIVLFLTLNGLHSLWDIIFNIIMILILIFHASKIYPYIPIARKQVADSHLSGQSNHITIVTANVQKNNRQSENCLSMIKNVCPDILILVEIDQWWVHELRHIEQYYEYQVSYPQENPYGMMLFSKFELQSPTVEFLIKDDIPSIHTTVKYNDKQSFKLISVHPAPPTPPHIDGDTNNSKERDHELYAVARRIKNYEGPVIVAGDLNDVAWSLTTKAFQKRSGLLDPRQGRGFFNSFHAKYFFLRFPLDHIFVSKHFLCSELKRLDDIHSDHFPIYARLTLQKDTPKS